MPKFNLYPIDFHSLHPPQNFRVHGNTRTPELTRNISDAEITTDIFEADVFFGFYFVVFYIHLKLIEFIGHFIHCQCQRIGVEMGLNKSGRLDQDHYVQFIVMQWAGGPGIKMMSLWISTCVVANLAVVGSLAVELEELEFVVMILATVGRREECDSVESRRSS